MKKRGVNLYEIVFFLIMIAMILNVLIQLPAGIERIEQRAHEAVTK